jgi:hypothetical protein
MMRLLWLAVALGLLLAEGACGSPDTTAGSQPTGGPISSASPAPARPNQASPDSRAIDLRLIKWTRVEAGKGRQLIIHYTAAGLAECNVLGQVIVAETVTTVAVTVLVGHLPGTNCGGIQPMLAAPFVTTVTLREPLGTRTVIDGAG